MRSSYLWLVWGCFRRTRGRWRTKGRARTSVASVRSSPALASVVRRCVARAAWPSSAESPGRRDAWANCCEALGSDVSCKYILDTVSGVVLTLGPTQIVCTSMERHNSSQLEVFPSFYAGRPRNFVPSSATELQVFFREKKKLQVFETKFCKGHTCTVLSVLLVLSTLFSSTQVCQDSNKKNGECTRTPHCDNRQPTWQPSNKKN